MDTDSPEEYFRQFFIEYATLSSVELDRFGDMTEFGVPDYQDKMKDLSDEAHKKFFDMLKAALTKLETLNAEIYDSQTKYNIFTIKWFLENKIEGEKYRYHEAILAPMMGFEQEIYDIFLNQTVIENLEDAQNLISRMYYVQKK